MLVLLIDKHEEVSIGDQVTIRCYKKGKVAIEAPRGLKITRKDITEKLKALQTRRVLNRINKKRKEAADEAR